MKKNILGKIQLKSLKIIRMSEGNIMHVLKKKELKSWSFSEAYFSKIKFKKIKAWKYHKKMVLNLVVPKGKVKFVFYSKKNKRFKVIKIGEKKYSRILVPPKVWFGFQGLHKPESIILNIANINHNKKEILRKSKNDIQYDWR
jgi:dTDP-4-dehydrorhamnose 3,5-epimerase